METRLEDLRKWFGKGKKGDWVRVGTDGEIKGQCAREPGEGKPKCMPRDKAHSMDKKDRASSARRKRRADPMADRPGTGNKPIMVKTDKKESVDMKEATMADRQVFKAIRVAKDMGGNMTGAVRRIEKMKKGLSDHPKVKAALRLANETYKPDPDGGNHKAVKAAQTRAKIAKYNAQTRKANNESVDLEEKNVPTNPALWAKFKAQAKAKFDVYPSAYANGWAAKKYKAAGGGWKTTKENTEMKSFHELREGKVSAKFTDHSPNKDFNDLAKKNRLKVTHDKNSEVTTVHGDEKGVLSLLKTMYGNDWKYMYTKKGSTYVDESVKEAVGDTALAFQTPQGTVTATKRNTKGMRGKQDGYSLSLKTKSGKTVDLGSHPNPTKANVMSIAKNVMQKESSQLDELSPSTVKSYLHKRIMDPDHKRTQYSYQKKARDARAAGNEPESAKNRAKAKKIGTGIHRATARDMAHDTGHDKYRHKSVKRVPQAYKDRAKK